MAVRGQQDEHWGELRMGNPDPINAWQPPTRKARLVTTPAAGDGLAAWLTQIWDEDDARLTDPTFCGPVWPTTAELLARIAADRQILELHTGPHDCTELHTGTYADDWPEDASWGKAGTEWRHAVNEYFDDEPCPTQRLLASPYVDRPGFQEAWRPGCDNG
jgi:hypothetical protein